MMSENKYAAESLQYSIDCALKNQVPGLVALAVVEEVFENDVEGRYTEAEKCGMSTDCLKCFNLALCGKYKAKRDALLSQAIERNKRRDAIDA